MSRVFVIGPPQEGCFKIPGGLRVVKPVRDVVWALLTAVSGYDEGGEPIFTEVITRGSDEGIDRLARAWAEKHMMAHIAVPARVSSFGAKKAVDVQVKEILDKEPAYVISFKSPNTKAFVDRLCASGALVFEVDLGEQVNGSIAD